MNQLKERENRAELRKLLLKWILETDQFVREVECSNRDPTDTPPFDCEGLRVYLFDLRQSLILLDAGHQSAMQIFARMVDAEIKMTSDLFSPETSLERGRP